MTLQRASREPGRSAFSLIELLVVVLIVGVLAGLLLPAVQAAREASRRVQCVANLRQIGTALHAYHALHNMFPPAHLPTVRGYDWSSNTRSCFLALLPHLEQQVLYASINTDFVSIESRSFPTLENHTARNTALAVFLCPSDGEEHHRSSYRFNRGRCGVKRGWAFDGPFSIGVYPSATTVRDGLSRTAFVSERVGGSFSAGTDDPRRDVKYPAPTELSFSSDDQFIPYCVAAPAAGWNVTVGRYWVFDGVLDTSYNHNGGPNDPRPTCSGDAWHGAGLHPPRSYHPGGVNLLFGDGHAEFVGDGVAKTTWLALGTHDSGD